MTNEHVVSRAFLYLISTVLPLCATSVVFADCDDQVPAPAQVPIVGAAVKNGEAAASVLVGPGGPVYAHVRNNAKDVVAFTLIMRKPGGSLTSSFCATGGALRGQAEFWVEMVGGESLPSRSVELLTGIGVNNLSLELSVYKAPK